jgi:cell division protease FtsH
MQGAIDREVKKFVETGLKRAMELLKKHQDKLDLIAAELIKKETIESDEFESLMGGPKTKIE